MIVTGTYTFYKRLRQTPHAGKIWTRVDRITERHLRTWRSVESQTFYRKKHNSDLWHFCSNCTNWPIADFDATDRGAPPSGEFCGECVDKQHQGTCEQPKGAQPNAPIARKKILIIDDQSDVRRVLTISLRHLGYETCEASDGSAGIRMSLTEHPDLILMDLSLPDSSGLETAIGCALILLALGLIATWFWQPW